MIVFLVLLATAFAGWRAWRRLSYFLHVFQLEGYKINEYKAWIRARRGRLVFRTSHAIGLSAIDVPVLLFWGTKDEAVTRHQIDIMQRAIPDVGVVQLEDAGHYGYLDDFDTFLAATLKFLDITETESVTEAEDI